MSSRSLAYFATSDKNLVKEYFGSISRTRSYGSSTGYGSDCVVVCPTYISSWFVKMQFTLDELGTSFAFVVSSIFASRLLISIRSAHFKEEENTIRDQLPSIHFAKNDAIELANFNERIGV